MMNVYPTKDAQFVVLAGSEQKFVQNLFNALGRPEFIEPVSGLPGEKHWPAIEYLREAFQEKTRAEWVDWFADKDVCFAPVLDLNEAWEHPQVYARDMRLKDDGGNDHVGVPIKYLNEPARPDLALPGLGEHSEEILATLNFSADEIAAMKESGAR